VRLAAVVFLLPSICFAQQPHEQQVQRALIQLDERGAAFSRGEAPSPLPPQAGQPLSPDPEVARQLRPYERLRMAEQREHVLQLPPPVIQEPRRPLPLPRRAERGVDAVEIPRPRD
jgi:hypothetical protein